MLCRQTEPEWKASQRLEKSTDMIDQQCLIKSVLKPSGPEALLEGRFLTTVSILALEKLSTRLERSGGFVKWAAK